MKRLRSLVALGSLAAVVAGILAAALPAASVAASSPCAKAAPAVDKIVNFHKATFKTDFVDYHVPASAASGGVSAVGTECQFGEIFTDVTLQRIIFSKPQSISAITRQLKDEPVGGKRAVVTSYAGLGMPAVQAVTGSGSNAVNEIIVVTGSSQLRIATSGFHVNGTEIKALLAITKAL